MGQYRKIKAQHPDVILMFRLGDFYEMFWEDAVVASQALEITLTARPDPGRDEKIPMCGVPFHAVDRYVARLIAKGHRVAICDQMEDARFAKGLVKREVTRVVTPGTVLEDAMLEAKANNYLLAAVPGGAGDAVTGFGLAVCDVSTGEFLVTELAGAEAAQRAAEEIERLRPAEILLHEAAAETWRTFLTSGRGIPVTVVPANPFPRRTAYEQLLDHFGVTSLRGFGCEEMPIAIQAAAAILGYLKLTQIDAVAHIRSLATYSTAGFMGLDATARRNLELTQAMWDGGRSRSLLSVIDTSCTAMGGRLLRKWLEQPLLDVTRINERLDAVGELLGDALLRGEVRDALGRMSDLERLVSRCATGTGNARDLIGVRNSLQQLPVLRAVLRPVRTVYLAELHDRLDPLAELAALIEGAITDEPPISLREGGLIRPGHSEKLDGLRQTIAENREWITNLEVSERERTGVKSLKVGYNQVFGYYIEVTKPNLPYVPPDYHRKQTVANGERFITPELKDRESMIQKAEEQIFELEYQLFQAVREQVGRSAAQLLAVAGAAAELDVLAAYGETAARHGYARPVVDDSTAIVIRNGRHPVVERLAGEPFIPNDTLLDNEANRLLVITGPNMSGKSTSLRQVALIALMAQSGCYVPAEAAQIGVVDRIFTRVGAHDDLASGQSTFMVEMTETANILNNATERSLIILDEIGRGTSTYDGLSIAWAVAEYLQEVGAKTLFATHYHHLNDLAERLPGVKNYRMAVKEEGHHVIWLRKLVPGGTDKSYGIQVARMAGLPDTVIRRAREVLVGLERNGGNGAGLLAPDDQVAAKTQRVQLKLFELEEHPVLQEIRKLDLTSMTPMEALTRLFELQKKAGT
jgi:DNA mismatch repair protein MutS